ncbi:UNVERIFIED_CONTAM: hypothetical protein K2H54_030512 [Gekko kuhli]
MAATLDLPSTPASIRLLLLLHISLSFWPQRSRCAEAAEAAPEFSSPDPLPESAVQKPTVFLAILARNAARSLPHALGCVERLRYPKNRIAVWYVWEGGSSALSHARKECGGGGVSRLWLRIKEPRIRAWKQREPFTGLPTDPERGLARSSAFEVSLAYRTQQVLRENGHIEVF